MSALRVTRILWIADLWAATITPNDTLLLGTPPLEFRRASIVGVVIRCWEFEPNPGTIIYVVDDGTGLFDVAVTPYQLQYRDTKPSVGDIVDFSGYIVANGNHRHLECSGFDIKHDPMEEVCRWFQIDLLYRTVYFKVSENTSAPATADDVFDCISRSPTAVSVSDIVEQLRSTPAVIQGCIMTLLTQGRINEVGRTQLFTAAVPSK
ncbi:OB domain-containing protein [Plasmodiophora brassicae]|uniref:OB domain-containing protein n=1 Tax=Plasmodiophora brassicae TaxID=37360 RepID=A0A0G4IYS3_PLABS|nr:hypothetical protein PBRA_001539 [Plasmodiophora brassicae]SPQ94015.1 unnamed protein product [Plasmodiophora brassicae]